MGRISCSSSGMMSATLAEATTHIDQPWEVVDRGWELTAKRRDSEIDLVVGGRDSESQGILNSDYSAEVANNGSFT